MTQWVIGNWKLNGNRQMVNEVLTPLAKAGLGKHVAVCVPFPYIDLACQAVKGSEVQIGAQDVSQFKAGAYTGEVAAHMVAELGGQLTLIGHSERRTYFTESADLLKAKAVQALEAGLSVVFCVGENLPVRQSGQALEYVLSELASLQEIKQRLAIAYEPVWAIGTGLTASLDEIGEMHIAIKEYMGETVPVLYGGSVNATNAAAILAVEGVDGLLVGGAALKADEFIAIGRCSKMRQA
jgi:triosephosphate isomerase